MRLLLVVAAALIDGEGRILLAQRPAHKSLGGLWEFPGGKVEPDETPEAALVRELKEEIGIIISTDNLTPLTFASHSYDDMHLVMPLYLCRKWIGEAKGLEGQALAWVVPGRLKDYPMPPADLPLIPVLQKLN